MKPGTWGLFPVTVLEAFHPDDRSNVLELWDRDRGWVGIKSMPDVFELRAFEGEYALLQQGPLTFRGAATRFKPLEVVPSFAYGEHVRVRKTGEHGVVREIGWHYKRSTFIYLLLKGTRKSKARHFFEDLAKIEG